MEAKKVTIGIETTADASGAEKAVDAIDKVIDKGHEVDEALTPKPDSGLSQIPADAAPAVAALDKLDEKSQVVQDSLEEIGRSGLAEIPAAVAPAVTALDAVADKGKEVEQALTDADGKGLKKIPSNAQPAIGSLKQLEEEVRRLQSELAELPVGSAQFVAMAGKVNGAQKALQGAEAEARKFGATVKRGGNAGLAVQEFARGLEDAQYGMRGIQNNIPGLVLALGGGAGLAGVLSIAAVVGGQLWELLSKGSKEATADAIDYLAVAKKLSQEFGNDRLEIEKARGANADSNLAKQKEYAAAQQRIADSELDLEKQRIKGDGGVAVAKARLDLSRIEGDLLTATGEKALKLAKDREAALKRIVALEERNAELIRQAEVNAAVAKVNKAQEALATAGDSKSSTAARSSGLNQDVDRVANQLANALEERLKTIPVLTGLRDDAQENLKSATNPVDIKEFADQIRELQTQINKAFEPGDSEAKLSVQLDETKASAKVASDNFKKASDDQSAAAANLKAATEGLSKLRDSQDQSRKNEGEQKAIADTGGIEQKLRDAGAQTSQKIGQILTDIIKGLGDRANDPGIQSAIAQVKSLAVDGIQAGEQNEAVSLLGQLVSQIKGQGSQQAGIMKQAVAAVEGSVSNQAALISQLQALNSTVKEQGNQIKNLQQQQGNPNP